MLVLQLTNYDTVVSKVTGVLYQELMAAHKLLIIQIAILHDIVLRLIDIRRNAELNKSCIP